MTNSNTVYIIDGYGFVFRAYHIQPPLTSPSGLSAGAVYGFTSMLLKLLNDFKPKNAIIVFDSAGKNFRHQLYDQYKAHRPKAPEELVSQLPIVRQAAISLGFPIIEKVGYEADDIIATIATKVANEGGKSVIISSDKDLFQLMRSNILIYDPVKAKYIDETYIFEKYGVYPNQLREVMALIGDASDNIPGVKGIGPKSAALLIQQFSTVLAMIDSTACIVNPRHRLMIESSKDAALLSWQLVGLDCNVDLTNELTNFVIGAPHVDLVSNFLKEYGFKSLYKRVETLFQYNITATLIDEEKNSLLSLPVEEITNNENLVLLLEQADKNGYLSLLITEKKLQKSLFLSIDSEKAYLIHFTGESHQSNDLFTHNNQQDKVWFVKTMLPYLQNKSIKKITSNLKILYKLFGDIDCVEDLELMQYILFAGSKEAYKFTIEDDESGAKFVRDLYNQYNILLRQLSKEKLLNLYTDIDLPLCKILYQMERVGIKIDLEYLKLLSNEFTKEILELEEKIFLQAQIKFNIASNKQLGEILFDKMQLPFAKISTKSKQYTTDIEILEKLQEHGYEIGSLLIKWRELTKLKNTYTDGLQEHVTSFEHRIHTTFLQISTSTGRLSSINPNLQNIPIRTEKGNKVRAAFISPEGYELVSADYSQIELRILSHMADVPKLKEAFINGEDIHSLTACDIFKLKRSELTSAHRRQAKAINFGIIYGISAFGLAKQLNIKTEESAEYIKRYFVEYPAIQDYMENTKNYARKNGYVENLFGRKCFIPSINDKNRNISNFAERAAINAPIQGTSADIIKIAMNDIASVLQKQSSKTKLILQIHDELIFEVPKDEVDATMLFVKAMMEQASPLSVPTIVDVRSGKNWQEIH